MTWWRSIRAALGGRLQKRDAINRVPQNLCGGRTASQMCSQNVDYAGLAPWVGHNNLSGQLNLNSAGNASISKNIVEINEWYGLGTQVSKLNNFQVGTQRAALNHFDPSNIVEIDGRRYRIVPSHLQLVSDDEVNS